MNPLIQDDNISNNKPLPLVQFINGQFVIPSEAKDLLSSIRSKNIGIISLVGKYRTGKSFLLNRVLLNQSQSQGFGVGSSIKPCTKGIWIWPKPSPDKKKYSREHLAYLISICLLKQVVSLDDVSFILNL